MNKFTKFLLMGIIILFSVVACDNNPSENENDDPTQPALAEVVDIEFTIPDSTELLNFTSEQIDYNGLMVTGFSLDQFVNMDSVNLYIDEDGFDGRKLFAVEIASSDGYTPREHDYYDLTWEDFASGFLLPSEKGRTFFPDDNIESGYNVKWTHHLRLYRKIDVVLDGTSTIFETEAFSTDGIFHQAGNGNFYTDPGFSLTNLISDYIIENPDNYEYRFTSADDDDEVIFTWDDIQAGFWLATQNKAVFLNDDGTEFHSSFKKLLQIDLVEIQ